MVGHPFNPVYLMPLVEVVRAPDTPLDTVGRALAFFAAIGKRPIHVRREVPGHLANRLQPALWREAYSLVARAVATVGRRVDIGAHGPGLPLGADPELDGRPRYPPADSRVRCGESTSRP